MPHLQTILIPRGDEHSMANLGSVLKQRRGSWELNSMTHEIEVGVNGSVLNGYLMFKAILELLQISFVGRK